VIVGGDSHTLLDPESMTSSGLTPEGSYPTKLTDLNGQPICVVLAWQYGYVVGKIKVAFDSRGTVGSFNRAPMVLVGDSF